MKKKHHKKVIQAQSAYLSRIYRHAKQKQSRRFLYSDTYCKDIAFYHGRYIIQAFEIKERIKSLSLTERASLLRTLYANQRDNVDALTSLRLKVGRCRRLQTWSHRSKETADEWFNGVYRCGPYNKSVDLSIRTG